MNEFDFVLLMTYMFGGFAVICIALMIIETLAKELDLLYLELQKGKEINIAEYIKEKK